MKKILFIFLIFVSLILPFASAGEIIISENTSYIVLDNDDVGVWAGGGHASMEHINNCHHNTTLTWKDANTLCWYDGKLCSSDTGGGGGVGPKPTPTETEIGRGGHPGNWRFEELNLNITPTPINITLGMGGAYGGNFTGGFYGDGGFGGDYGAGNIIQMATGGGVPGNYLEINSEHWCNRQHCSSGNIQFPCTWYVGILNGYLPVKTFSI